jgi:hypothetical protein
MPIVEINVDAVEPFAHGIVEYDTDFVILRPAEQRPAGGVIVYDVTNRGRKVILGRLDEAGGNADANNPRTARDAGLALPSRAATATSGRAGFSGGARQ